MAQWLLTLGVALLASLVSEVRTQAAMGAAGAPAGGAGATAGYTTSPKHPFCTAQPPASAPKITIFTMNVQSGFQYGYRSNQSVLVEIKANFPQVWRIQQVFLYVPDNDPKVNRVTGATGYQKHKSVGHWAWSWNMRGTADPKVGQTEPVDCGGMSTFGTFGMVTPYGAHAAKLMTKPTNPANPNEPNKGYESVVAKWVPPSNWENLLLRKTVTIEAYVTFEKTPPEVSIPHTHPGYTHVHKPQGRWVKLTTTLLNLDLIDLHNYLRVHYPLMMTSILRLG